MADFNLGRMKFVWQGEWVTGTQYVKDDVVRNGANTYVCVIAHTAGTFNTDSGTKWELMIPGNSGSPLTTDGDLYYFDGNTDARLPIGTSGQALIVNDTGYPAWTALATAESIYYVKADGDDDNTGSNLNEAFKTIRHACDTVTGPATIYVKGGLYYERLPITVAPNVTIVGDGQRTTGVAPINITNNSASINPTTGAQTSTTIVIDDSADIRGTWTIDDTITISSIQSGSGITGTVTITNITPATPIAGTSTITVSFTSQTVTATDCTISSDHSSGTMWRLNDGATLNKMFFKDMQGFAPNLATPEDITTATIAGIFVALDPDHPIINKSPYVIECSAFGDNGAIGALVDGDLHATGNKSILFHAYTVVCSDGVGFWVKGQGKSEIVSCFTYFCWYGYTTTGGGKIRALNGNNSYGTYGVVSRGFDADETPNIGAIYGNQLVYNPLTLVGEFSVGNTITGSTSGATGTITNVQSAVNKFYYVNTNGFTFQAGETITAAGGKSAVIETGGATGQLGFVIVADGFSEEPRPGGSVSITGDTLTYVIQSVSGTYTNSSSVLTIVFANEKPNASVNNTALEVRYGYSSSRLTGHDFLSIGTGGKITTNYPGEPTQSASQANEVIENYPGRAFYVSTDQDGNFRVGDYFRVDQATGRATLNASAFDLSGLTSLRLGSIGAQLGELVSEFSSDATLSGNSNEAVPTEGAVRGYFSQVATSIVPAVDLAQDLGSSTKRWRELFVGPGSITLGTLTITDNAGTLEIKSGATAAPTLINAINNGTSSVSVAAGADITITAANTLAATFSGANTTLAGELRGPATFTIDPAAVGDNTGTVVIKGNLQVDGTTTTINSTTLTIDDKNIVLGSGSANDAAADGSGITVESGDGNKTFNWIDATNAFTANQNIGVASTYGYLINGTSVLNATTLGSGVTGSSLTSVGTLANLTVTNTIVGSVNGSSGSSPAGSLTGSTLASGVTASSLTSVGTLTGLVVTNNQAAQTNIDVFNNNSSGSGGIRVGYDSTSHLRIFRNGNAADFLYNATQSGANHIFQTNGSTTWNIGSTGNCVAAGTITSNSDARLKTNVTTITGALDKVLALRGVMFDRISTGTHEMGTIAQEVEAVVPQLVFTDENGMKSVAYANTVALLIEAIKEQQIQIDELKTKLN